MTTRRNWIKIYVDQCLRGTMMDELEDPAKRFVWFGFLLLAGDCPFEGYIKITESMGYTDEQLAALLKVETSLIVETKPTMEQYNKIKLLDNNIIKIVNWKRYQSEYSRQKQYRGDEKFQRKENRNSNSKLQVKVTPKSDQEIRLDKDKIKRENIKKNNMSKKRPKKPKKRPKKPDDVERSFEILRTSFPAHRRGKRQYCFTKFKALCKKGKKEEFRQTTIGYFEYLKDQKLNHNFEQEPMGLSTWMNNWEGDKELYFGFEYKPKL